MGPKDQEGEEEYIEGEPELDSLDEYIVDDSDDEFIPGAKGKKMKKKGGANRLNRKRGSIKASTKKV